MADNAIEDHAGSIPDNVPPLRLIRWTRFPLIALAIVSIGPSILTPFVYMGLRPSGVHELEGQSLAFLAGSQGGFLRGLSEQSPGNHDGLWPFATVEAVPLHAG